MKKISFHNLALNAVCCACLAGTAAAQTGTMMIDSSTMANAMRSPAPAFISPQLTMLRMQMLSTGTATLSIKPAALTAQSTRAKIDIKQAQPVRSGMTEGPSMFNGALLIEAMAIGDNAVLIGELTAAGATDLEVTGNLVRGKLPAVNIERLSTLTSARFVRPILQPGTNSGPVNSQGDPAQKSDVARTRFNVSGAGVTVGVISDSYDKLGGASKGVAAGELPGVGNNFGYTTPVKVVKEGSDRVAFADEGRAMAEIVHDVAPGAAIAFYGASSVNDHAKGIRDLAAAGATVIVDDLFYSSEPYFQPSPIAIAARDVALQHNAVVISSAGNNERKSLEGNFKPLPAKDLFFNGANIGKAELHDFGGGRVTVPIFFANGYPVRLAMQWDDKFSSYTQDKQGAAIDLDIFLFSDEQGVNILAGSTEANIGKDPNETVVFRTPDGPGEGVVYLGIARSPDVPAATGVKFKVIALDSSVPGTFSEYPAEFFSASTTFGHSNSEWIITSCAANYRNTQASGGATVEPYSALGGLAQLRDQNGNRLPAPFVPRKPDVCSPAGANTSFFLAGEDPEGDGIPNFNGTSASAPHAAGIAALMIEAADNNLPAFAINYIFRASAKDMDDPLTPQFDKGVDFRTGAGFLDANRAVNIASFFRNFPPITFKQNK